LVLRQKAEGKGQKLSVLHLFENRYKQFSLSSKPGLLVVTTGAWDNGQSPYDIKSLHDRRILSDLTTLSIAPQGFHPIFVFFLGKFRLKVGGLSTISWYLLFAGALYNSIGVKPEA
jgi:hypothetical protein